MKKLVCLIIVCAFLIGCTNPSDSLSDKALTMFVNNNYTLGSSVRLDKIKVLKSELTRTDLNNKYYTCFGLIKFKCTADSPLTAIDGPINSGDDFYQLVYVKLTFKQGSTGVIETGSFDREFIYSKSGKEIPKDQLRL